MDEVQKGRPVAIIFPDSDAPGDSRLGTLFLPNTLCILKRSPSPEGARKLVDFLLSAEIEKALAEGDSHQLPVNPDVPAELPLALRAARDAKPMRVDWNRAADHWQQSQDFLAAEFAAQ
jgi:iron(III) transport system substrate-binding protein